MVLKSNKDLSSEIALRMTETDDIFTLSPSTSVWRAYNSLCNTIILRTYSSSLIFSRHIIQLSYTNMIWRAEFYSKEILMMEQKNIFAYMEITMINPTLSNVSTNI